MPKTSDLSAELTRIAEALERLSPPPPKKPDFKKARAALWYGSSKGFETIKHVNAVPLEYLVGIDSQKQQLLENTEAFQKGFTANNTLLWGARGMGKSSLIKAVHQHQNKQNEDNPLILIEILREEIDTIDQCLAHLKERPERFILFCDDLSFEPQDKAYKALKAVLEGGIIGRPDNVLFYATSNQRHLLPRRHSEYENRDYLNDTDITNETVSLSDRFGLWLGFHNCSNEDYKQMVINYAVHYKIPLVRNELLDEAHKWQMARGARSGRVAWQYIQHLLGKYEIQL